MARKLEVTVTERKAVTGVIADLVHFAEYLESCGCIRFVAGKPSDDALIQLARDFWDREHGE